MLPNDDETTPHVVAHRGYSSVTPENTLAAVASGWRSGADWVEIDVATSADGEPYVLHDNTVDRTTDGTGALPSLTAPYLDGLDAGSWFSPAFAGQILPQMAPVLDEIDLGTADLLLEIKGPETRAELERIIGDVRARGLLGRTLLQSFDEQVLRDSRAIAPDLRLGLLRSTLDADPVATSQAFDVVAYNPSWAALQPRAGEIERLNAAGVAVMPYTVDDPGVWPTMRDAGADAIITNRPGALVGWNARYAQTGPGGGPARAEILAPAGDELERGDARNVAVDTGGAEGEIALDGEPVEEGDLIEADALELGEHEVTLGAGEATDTATFTVVASQAGLMHLAGTKGSPSDSFRMTVLRQVLDERWAQVARTVELQLAPVRRRALGADRGRRPRAGRGRLAGPDRPPLRGRPAAAAARYGPVAMPSLAELEAVARGAPPRPLDREDRARIAAARAVVEDAVAAGAVDLRRHDRLRPARRRADRARRRGAAAAQPAALARGRVRAAARRRGRARHDARCSPRRCSRGHSGVRAELVELLLATARARRGAGDPEQAGRSARRATWRRWRTSRSCSWARARPCSTGRRWRAARRSPRAGLAPVALTPRRGSR